MNQQFHKKQQSLTVSDKQADVGKLFELQRSTAYNTMFPHPWGQIGLSFFFGCLLDENLSWKEHIKYNENKIV